MRSLFVLLFSFLVQMAYCQPEASSFSRLDIDDFYILPNTETNKLILDVRLYTDFKKEHISGSISVEDKNTLSGLTDTYMLNGGMIEWKRRKFDLSRK